MVWILGWAFLNGVGLGNVHDTEEDLVTDAEGFQDPVDVVVTCKPTDTNVEAPRCLAVSGMAGPGQRSNQHPVLNAGPAKAFPVPGDLIAIIHSTSAGLSSSDRHFAPVPPSCTHNTQISGEAQS